MIRNNAGLSTRRVRALVAIVSSTVWVGAAPHQTVAANTVATWNGPAGLGGTGNWTDATSWSTGVVPTNGATKYDVDIDGGKPAASTVNLSGSFQIDNLTVDAGDALNIANGSALTVAADGTAASVTDNGLINLNSTGSNTDLVIGANTAFNGTGTFQLSNNFNNRIYANSNQTLTIGSGQTIQGAGQIGVGLTTIVNNGIIDSNSSVGITINPGSGGFTNNNLLEASGAVLTMEGSYTNTAATIEALTGGEVRLTGATVTGGILSSTGTGFIDFAPNDTINNVTINGNSTEENGTSVTVTGGALANNGIYSLNSSGSFTDVIIAANTAFNGTGTFQLSNNINNRIYANGNQTLTIGSGQTIQGAGQIGVGQTGIVNNGIIDANSSAGMTIDPGSGGFTNNNLVEANGAVLTMEGSYTNAATIRALTGSEVKFISATVAGGTISATGTGFIDFAPNDTINNVTINGNSTEENGTTVTVIGGALTNNGVYSMNSSGSTTDVIVAANTAFNGTGTFQLSNNINNRIYANGNQTLTIGSGQTIQGAGQVGVGLTVLVNNGVIDANSSAGLTVSVSGITSTNNNLIEAQSGSTLTLIGTYSNAGSGLIKALDTAAIALNSATVSNNSITGTATGQITSSGNSALNNLTVNGPLVNSSGTLALNTVILNGNFTGSNGTVTDASGTLTNNAIFTLNGSGSTTDFAITANTLLNGTGTVQLSNFVNNRIYAVSNQTLNIGSGETIQGAGQIGVGQTAIMNNGIIDANSSAGMTIDPGGGGFTNNNLIEASGAVLMMEASYTNTAATIEALAGGEVKFSGATVTGGILSTTGTGVLDFASSNTLNNVTINGNSTEENAAAVTVTGGALANNGTYSLNSSGSFTDVIIAANTAFNGTGTFQLSNNVNNRIYANGSQTLTIGGGQTIQGAGEIGVGQTAIVNNGVIDANSSAGLTVSVSGITSTNNNLIEATAGATLNLLGTLANTASVSTNSTSTIVMGGVFNNQAGGSVTNPGSITVTGTLTSGAASTISNSGAFKVDQGGTATISTGLLGGGNVTVGDPSGSPSHLTVASIKQNSLLIDVTGRMMISNNASTTTNTLNSLTINSGGSLDMSNNHIIINYGAGPDPAATIRSYLTTGYAGGAWTGAGIDSSTAALPANSHYALGYADGADGVVAGLSSGQVEIKYTLYGDADLDGLVTGNDFTILVSNLAKSGRTWDQGDFDYDGSVTGNDFTALVANLGKSASGAAIVLPASDYAAIDAFAAANGLMADVPEPASAGALVLFSLGALTRRQRGARRRIS
jgi:hypothetical protein